MPETPRIKHIDPHVHCRDWGESAKSTIREVMQLAKSQGIVAIIDMPNTKPPITTAALVERRLLTAKDEGCLGGYYLFIGATSDPRQLIEASQVATSNPKVVGIKMYAGRSVGDLAVIGEAEQRRAFQALADAGYKGVLAVHCEKEGLARPELWIPGQPDTWNLAKPPEMEVEAVRDQIRFARETGFQGHLHICHISTPEAVKLVDGARGHMNISCGVTPHHLTLSTQDMQTAEGIKLKVNPPLRDRKAVSELMKLLETGKIDWIETDHAPHTKEEKTYDPGKPKDFFMSGIRSLEGYAEFLQGLTHQGFTDRQIEELTYSNIKRVFTKITE
jgi:dihydroorotase